jgi:hypothetical protein
MMSKIPAFLRRLALVRAVYALLATADDEGAVVAVMTAYPDAKQGGGMTDAQIERINQIGESQSGMLEMADAFSGIIRANHRSAGPEIVDEAANIDLLRALRLVERETVLPPSPPSVADLVERLDRIRRIVSGPVRLLSDDLDDTQVEPASSAQRSLRF